MEWIDVNEAAGLLDVDPRQVRNLLAHGKLEGHKVGRVWLVSESAVRGRLRSSSLPGRPLSAEMTWLLLGALDRAQRGCDPFSELVDDRRVRWRLRASVHRAPPSSQWPAWLRRRGEPHRLWLHPAALERFADDHRVAHPDLSDRLGVQIADLVPFYVAASDLRAVVDDHHGRLDEGDVPVMAVGDVGGEVSWRDAVDAAALVDLASAPDARVAAAALAALDAARLWVVRQEPKR